MAVIFQLSRLTRIPCICTVTAMCPPSPPQMCSGIRGGEDSSKRCSWTNGFTYLPEYTCPPAPWKSAATSAGGGERYSMECAHHGWHHEPHSPVKNTMCKRWDTPEKTRFRRAREEEESVR